MGQPYVGEIRMFGGNFAPAGWAFCNGALVSISDNPTLFNLIGTTYGGNGTTNFQLPNLQSRVPVHQGTSPFGTYTMAQTGGVETVTLTTAQIPNHPHVMQATRSGQQDKVASNVIPAVVTAPALGAAYSAYGSTGTHPTTLATGTIGNSIGGQPHNNLQPFLVLNFIIALYGIYPSPT